MSIRIDWQKMNAVELCRELEALAPIFGGHVALTGGCLYKDGARKDLDILIYRSTDEPPFRWDDFFAEVKVTHGIELVRDCGFVKKAKMAYAGNYLAIDFFDPFGVYVPGSSEQEADTTLDELLKF